MSAAVAVVIYHLRSAVGCPACGSDRCDCPACEYCGETDRVEDVRSQWGDARLCLDCRFESDLLPREDAEIYAASKRRVKAVTSR